MRPLARGLSGSPSSWRWRLLPLFAALALAPSCKRCGFERAPSTVPAERSGPAVILAAPKLAPTSGNVGPGRIVLDAAALTRLRRAAVDESPVFRSVEARCDEAVRVAADWNTK